VHPDVELGGATAVELRGGPAVIAGFCKLGPIILGRRTAHPIAADA
jgi:hypothetical protein